MNKFDLVKIAGLDGFAYDFALPQTWCDAVVDYLTKSGAKIPTGYDSFYQVLIGGTVYLYDDHASVFGRPFPITPEAENLLLTLPPIFGASSIPAPERKSDA